MAAYYNENDPFAAAWLRELIREKFNPDIENWRWCDAQADKLERALQSQRHQKEDVMSQIVMTSLGRFRRVRSDAALHEAWLWECPCGQWAHLSAHQLAGSVSVDHASEGCPLRYHETHDFGAALRVALTEG